MTRWTEGTASIRHRVQISVNLVVVFRPPYEEKNVCYVFQIDRQQTLPMNEPS